MVLAAMACGAARNLSSENNIAKQSGETIGKHHPDAFNLVPFCPVKIDCFQTLLNRIVERSFSLCRATLIMV